MLIIKPSRKYFKNQLAAQIANQIEMLSCSTSDFEISLENAKKIIADTLKNLNSRHCKVIAYPETDEEIMEQIQAGQLEIEYKLPRINYITILNGYK